MCTIAILASGQSLTQEDVDYIKLAREDSRLDRVIAVSNVGIDMAPWADALVSHDSGWWIAHPEAVKFAGRKFSRRGYTRTEAYTENIPSGLNSGLMAMYIARDVFKAEKLILLGFDMHGTHYFGPHTAIYNNRPLNNTNNSRFQQHIAQFSRFDGCEVVNCTPNSALKRFVYAGLREII